MANLLFYLMGAGALAAAIGVVAAKNPVWSVLSLLTSFFCLATIYLLAGYQFMAAAQILVYAGAIMVLFLFVIMLLNLGSPTRDRWIEREVLRKRRLPLVMGVCGMLLAITLVAVGVGGAVLAGEGSEAAVPPASIDSAQYSIDSAQGLAAVLFGRYMLAFEASGILLLSAAVAVLVLAKRERGKGPAAEENA